MIKYYIENEKGEFITKPGSGHGGWTRDWRKAWKFELNDDDRIIHTRLNKDLGIDPPEDPRFMTPIVAAMIMEDISRTYPEKLELTRHDMEPMTNDILSEPTLWRCKVTHNVYTECGSMSSGYTGYMTNNFPVHLLTPTKSTKIEYRWPLST